MVSRPIRPICNSAGKVTAQLLLSFLAVSASPSVADIVPVRGSGAVLAGSPILSPLIPEPPEPAEHTLTLRHIFHHGTYEHPDLHRRKDITEPEAEVWLAEDDGFAAERIPSLKAKSQSRRIERLVDRRPSVVDPMVAEARQRGAFFVSSPSAWTVDDIPGPNITDKETVLTMALIAADAYVEKPGMPDWEEVGKPFNKSEDFGWESDGLRGHIWGDESNSTVIIGLKGTSPAVFDGEGTTTNDKCNNTCVREALHAENRYYQAARELYANVTELYPESNIWVVGHSLGGAVSSLLGLTYGLPVVTFEAVPEALAAGRLGLPVPPNADPNYPQTREYTGAFHFGHTADPVYIGTCNGATASCSYAGYAMESACHTGYECAYDTVADKGWRVGIGTHKIRAVIKDVLEAYDEVAECKFTPECRDCTNWKMYESNSTDGTTSSSSSTSSKTRTRTATCKTPGWWGCLDETTTTATATTTTSSSTSTCKTPGWFGCKDETTTTTSGSSSSTATTTCETPGWFGGCKDKVIMTSTSSPTAMPKPHPITPAPSMTNAPTATPTEPPTASCIRRNWIGICKEYGEAFGEL
ncbi:hypothetical protein DL769_000395 [Monosporascus sp. CRB-8-3]|nr:hypothetical protein DL769_000395 [Monosporascus sp. CRB-8-3]